MAVQFEFYENPSKADEGKEEKGGSCACHISRIGSEYPVKAKRGGLHT
ncbi:hypothetical protein [Bacteroides sp. 214]|nr:hypothetical protein [Bacteroides sp. 214]